MTALRSKSVISIDVETRCLENVYSMTPDDVVGVGFGWWNDEELPIEERAVESAYIPLNHLALVDQLEDRRASNPQVEGSSPSRRPRSKTVKTALVAQSEERLPCKQEVGGSTPPGGSTLRGHTQHKILLDEHQVMEDSDDSAPVAQLAEQGPFKSEVVGSSPSGRTNSSAPVAKRSLQRTHNPKTGSSNLPRRTIRIDGQCEVSDFCHVFEDIIYDPAKTLIFHNAKFDTWVLEVLFGREIGDNIIDTMLEVKLDNENGRMGLKEATRRYLRKRPTTLEEVTGGSNDPSCVDIETVARYCRDDAEHALMLHRVLHPELKKQELWDGPWMRLWRPYIKCLRRMEHRGICVDVDYLQRLREQCHKICRVIQQGVSEAAGREINPSSHKQVSELLFNQLGLPEINKRSAAYEVLEQLAKLHPVPRLLLNYRGVMNTATKEVDGLLNVVDAHDRIHANFVLFPSTGRLACVARGTPVEIVRDVSKYPKGVPIEEVKPGDLAYSYDKSGKLVLRRVLAAWRRGVRPVVRVHWQGSGHKHVGYVDLTSDHLVRLTSGRWVPAGELKPRDRVFALSRGIGRWGYARLYPSGQNEIPKEHRFVYEQVFGARPEHVHHKNDNKADNRPENLQGMTRSEHARHHGENVRPETRLKRSIYAKAHPCLPPIRRGPENRRWLSISRDEMETSFREAGWSVVKAAKLCGCDFDAFKSHARHEGVDLKEMRRRNRAGRLDQILAGAARARAVRLRKYGWNHEVLRVEPLAEAEVFDLTIEDTENFIAGEICVHNCRAPNLQNVKREGTARFPIDDMLRGAVDPEFLDGDNVRLSVRSAFVPPAGQAMIVCDFNQLELRLMAHFANVKVMLEAYGLGEDLHAKAAALFKCSRQVAKTCNFGLLYGAWHRKLRDILRMEAGVVVSEAESERLWRAFHSTYPEIQQFQRRLTQKAKMNGGEIRTVCGRKRRCPELFSEDRSIRMEAERELANAIVQGSGADLVQVAQIRIEESGLPIEVVLQVHDEIVSYAPEDRAEELLAVQVNLMETAIKGWKIPIVVDGKIVKAWSEK